MQKSKTISASKRTTEHLKKIMRNAMSWINSRKALILGLLIVISINEFTLAILDDNPPLSTSAIQKIRLFDILVLLLAFSHRNIFTSPLHTLKAAVKIYNKLPHTSINIFVSIRFCHWFDRIWVPKSLQPRKY